MFFDEEFESLGLVGTQLLQRSENAMDGCENSPEPGAALMCSIAAIRCETQPFYRTVAEVVAAFTAMGYWHALTHLSHYLLGSGEDLDVDLADLFNRNPRALQRVAEKIRHARRDGQPKSGAIEGVLGESPIRQQDYDDTDWEYALGFVDRITYASQGEPDAQGRVDVVLTLEDPYQWHPQEDRPTQCIHEAMETMKWLGAKEYFAVGTGHFQLELE